MISEGAPAEQEPASRFEQLQAGLESYHEALAGYMQATEPEAWAALTNYEAEQQILDEGLDSPGASAVRTAQERTRGAVASIQLEQHLIEGATWHKAATDSLQEEADQLQKPEPDDVTEARHLLADAGEFVVCRTNEVSPSVFGYWPSEVAPNLIRLTSHPDYAKKSTIDVLLKDGAIDCQPDDTDNAERLAKKPIGSDRQTDERARFMIEAALGSEDVPLTPAEITGNRNAEFIDKVIKRVGTMETIARNMQTNGVTPEFIDEYLADR
jgi:hypothetical protein